MNLLGVFFEIGAVTIPFLIGSLFSSLDLSNILLLAVVLSLVPLGHEEAGGPAAAGGLRPVEEGRTLEI